MVEDLEGLVEWLVVGVEVMESVVLGSRETWARMRCVLESVEALVWREGGDEWFSAFFSCSFCSRNVMSSNSSEAVVGGGGKIAGKFSGRDGFLATKFCQCNWEIPDET